MMLGDRYLLFATAFLRALATGMVGVLLGIYLARLDLDAREAGIVISVGLAGAAMATVAATVAADRIGQRRFLLGLSMLGVAGGLVAALGSDFWILAAASFVGMLNGMGRDRGAALVIEQAVLPTTATPEGRTGAFAWYHLVQDVGHALGALLAGFPTLLSQWGVADLPALRGGMGLYTALLVLAVPLYLGLSGRVSASPGRASDALAEEQADAVAGLLAVRAR
jgi:MFS family permease